MDCLPKTLALVERWPLVEVRLYVIKLLACIVDVIKLG